MNIFKIVGWIFLVIGLLLLAGGFLAFKGSSAFIDSAESVQGIVLKNEMRKSVTKHRDSETGRTTTETHTYFYPVLEYVVNGVSYEFESNIGANPPSYKVGDKVDLLYAPDNVEDVRIKSFSGLWIGTIILCASGVLFTFIGGICIKAASTKMSSSLSIVKDGLKVETEFVEVIDNIDTEKNILIGYKIKTHWTSPTDGRIHEFLSDNIKYDPKNKITGQTFTVYFMPQDPSLHVMDLSSLSDNSLYTPSDVSTRKRSTKGTKKSSDDDLDWSL